MRMTTSPAATPQVEQRTDHNSLGVSSNILTQILCCGIRLETVRFGTVRFGRQFVQAGDFRRLDKPGGFNGSTEHEIETQAQGFQQPRVVRERRLNGAPSWLGFD